jgi:hypothetical protein
MTRQQQIREALKLLDPPRGEDEMWRELIDDMISFVEGAAWIHKRNREVFSTTALERYRNAMKAHITLHPVQADMIEKIKTARDELREAHAAAERCVLERTEMRIDDDGQFRSTHDPLPLHKLTPVPKGGGEQAAAS